MDSFTELQIEHAKLTERMEHLSKERDEIKERRQSLISDGTMTQGLLSTVPKGCVPEHNYWKLADANMDLNDNAMRALRVEQARVKLLTKLVNLVCDEEEVV